MNTNIWFTTEVPADNGGEFNNHEFISLCESLNILVCTIVGESPWSNSIV